MPQGIGSTTYFGNFYTLTGMLRDGQSINRVLFDAVSVGGDPTGLGGGFTFSSTAPEPSALAFLGMVALPLMGISRRRTPR